MQKNILILYGSTTGNSEKLAKYIHSQLSQSYNIKIHNVCNLKYPYTIDKKFNLIILCCSTWGIEPACLQEDFENWCLNVKKDSVDNKLFTIFALGDYYYPYFAYAYDILNNFIAQNKGIIATYGLKIHDPWEDSLNEINKEITHIIQKLK